MGGLTDVTLQQIIGYLQPLNAWDYLLYIILFFVLITLFLQGEGALTVTLLLAVVVIGIFLDKVRVFGNCGLEVMLIRVTYFVVPLIVAGVSRAPKSRPWAIIGAVLGLAYTFGTWFFVLQGPACPRAPRDTIVFLPLAMRALWQTRGRLMVDVTRLDASDWIAR